MYKVIKLKVQETEDGIEEELEGRPETEVLGRENGKFRNRLGRSRS